MSTIVPNMFAASSITPKVNGILEQLQEKYPDVDIMSCVRTDIRDDRTNVFELNVGDLNVRLSSLKYAHIKKLLPKKSSPQAKRLALLVNAPDDFCIHQQP